jgi:hypothetical protein
MGRRFLLQWKYIIANFVSKTAIHFFAIDLSRDLHILTNLFLSAHLLGMLHTLLRMQIYPACIGLKVLQCALYVIGHVIW